MRGVRLMRTSKPIATISYNTVDFLDQKLAELLRTRIHELLYRRIQKDVEPSEEDHHIKEMQKDRRKS